MGLSFLSVTPIHAPKQAVEEDLWKVPRVWGPSLSADSETVFGIAEGVQTENHLHLASQQLGRTAHYWMLVDSQVRIR